MKRFAFPILAGLTGVVLLLSLGIWQLRRLEWKESILAQIEAQIGAEPIAVPPHPTPDRDRYRAVTATGTITEDEVHLLVSTRETGAAFRIVSLFLTDDGRRLMLDRGIVASGAKDNDRPTTDATVTGNLLWPDEVDVFTPEPDREMNIWFARDAAALSQELAAEPFLIVLRETSETDPAVTPLPVDTASIPNDHREYAITWFGLAAVWAGMTIFWIGRIAREKG